MHKYLRAIGFSELKKNDELNALFNETIKNYDSKKAVIDEKGAGFAEFTREFAPGCGVCVCGEYNENGDFNIENYFPYLSGSRISTAEEVIIERRADNEAYIGACDDLRLDVSLIFHLINSADYLISKKTGLSEMTTSSVLLSALSLEGKILLPVLKTENAAKERAKKLQKRSALLMAARNGNEEAMESLTVEDMDVYNEISKRVDNEDLYTIIDNCFMPYGFGSDMYSIIGDISDYCIAPNDSTNEILVQMNVTCNDIAIDVCINQKDLQGEPEVGRRFKGVIWLQGTVEF